MTDGPAEYSYDSADGLLVDRRLLELSDIFDADSYRASAGISSEVNAAEHYLLEGWRRGLEPGPNFEGHFLYPYYRSVGFSGPPALTYLMLRSNGLFTYRMHTDVEAAATIVRNSEHFDPITYAADFPGMNKLDAALHYVLVGEQMGYMPSNTFDSQYYRERYSDAVPEIGNALAHYELHGRREGRFPVSRASKLTLDLSGLDSSRETVLVISHEASRTGAPILAYNVSLQLRAKYNVVALLLRGGRLVEDFEAHCSAVVGPLTDAEWQPAEAKRVVQRLVGACEFKFAIANSIETRNFSPWLSRAFVPVVTLVHEFASYTRPKDSMTEALDWATELVFSTELTAASAKAEHPVLTARPVHILPQGRCELPRVPVPERSSEAADAAKLRRLMRPEGAKDALIVLGAGAVHIRKGVDLFIACAAAVRALSPKRKVRFVWIGHGYDPERDMAYSCYLREQISRSNLDDDFDIFSEVTDMVSIYAETNVFFLSSRLDPLPNVTIDAAYHGIPIVCFDEASGIAEILSADDATSRCVVPYVDVNAAAHLIVELAEDEPARAVIAGALRALATATFDMDAYVDHLDKLGVAAAQTMRQRVTDYVTLDKDPTFDPTVFLHADSLADSRHEAIIEFLGYWSAVGLSDHGSRHSSFRRPCAGFHPQIYAHDRAGQLDPPANPFADYIRSGKPDGPWRHDVIPIARDPGKFDKLSVGLHGHFHYPELAADLVDKLAANRSRCDLLLTTGSEAKAAILRNATSTYDTGEVTVRIVPNRGRDIGAFLSAFYDEIVQYDVIGHVHGKQSVDLGGAFGDTWREFLWQNLLGDLHPMMDIVLAEFASDAGLGLVFPEDPYLVGWEENLEIAKTLARKIGITDPLPPFFDFPVGTMFWARTAALVPLLNLRFQWNDYPDEPLPYDGTVLHALERLLPFAAKHAGYRFATTHVPGITR